MVGQPAIKINDRWFAAGELTELGLLPAFQASITTEA